MALLFKWLIFIFPIAVIISLVEASYNEVKRIEEATGNNRRQQDVDAVAPKDGNKDVAAVATKSQTGRLRPEATGGTDAVHQRATGAINAKTK